MKGTQKVTRVKLNIEQNNDCILLGLVSAEPDYKLSLAINKKFKVSLRNLSPIRLTGENISELTFSRFSNHDDSTDLLLNLVANRSGKSHLLNKLKNIDYLLQIQISEKEVRPDNLTSKLREIDTITAVFNIDLSTLKDKNLHYLIQ